MVCGTHHLERVFENKACELGDGVEWLAQVVRGRMNELQQTPIGQLKLLTGLGELGVPGLQFDQGMVEVSAVVGREGLELIGDLLQAELRTHAREHDGGLEGLGDEIGGAELQPGFLVRFGGMPGHHDHGHVARGA
jgi:hypothetical protein